jgi:multidrug resistance efflux pump
MAVAFSRTLRALDADSSRPTLWVLFVGSAVLIGWTIWFLFARLPLFEVTDSARLEVEREAHVVASPLAGRVVSAQLELGREVRVGDLLVQLDSRLERLQLQEEQARRAALDPQLNALRAQIIAEKRAGTAQQQASSAALEEARARYREGDAGARFAEEQGARITRLHSEGLISEIDFLRGKAEAEKLRATAESLRLNVTRQEREQRTRDIERQARLQELERSMRQIEGQAATSTATIHRLKEEVERRTIRAPLQARLGEVANLRVGSYVDEGDKIASLVPTGELRVVANFPPPAVLGRIRPGQPARVRLQGFPWAQYGCIGSKVATVGSEVRDGHVRVELVLSSSFHSLIPLQHGLPGSVEVEVDRISPFALVMRVAGQSLAAPRPRVATPESGSANP